MKVALAAAALFNAIAGLVAGIMSASPIVGGVVFLGLPLILFVAFPLIVCSYALRWTREVLRYGRDTDTHPKIPGVLGFLDRLVPPAGEAPGAQLRLFHD